MERTKSQDLAQKIVVIGGGPAGMMAATIAGASGGSVTLLERNPGCGRKLLLTGGGRCNATNNILDSRKLLTKYKDAEQFLYSPFSQHSVKETLEFFADNGVQMKEEPGGRMFPTSDKSESILFALETAMKKNNVEVRTNAHVKEILSANNIISGVLLDNNETLNADAVIVATGGLSLPETGSTGDGFVWLQKLKHTIVKPNPSLVPVRTKEQWTHELSGLAFDGAKVTIIRDGKTFEKKTGKILFTHFGLSGPLILNMSKSIWKHLEEGETTLAIDLFPKLDHGALDKQLQDQFAPIQNKILRNALPLIIEKSLAPAVIAKLKLDGEKEVHQLTRLERRAIVDLLKDIRITAAGLLGRDKAIITSGGIPLEEIDTRAMRSRIYPNLYIVGDMLDIDRPSGGFSLQLCWTTGYVAGKHSVE